MTSPVRAGEREEKGIAMMNKRMIVTAALAATLALPLVACGGSAGSTSTDTGSAEATATETAGASDEAKEFFTGQWRGSVEVTGQTVYGTAGGNEQMLDVNFAEDGTVTVVPLETHADLLNAEGTYEGDPATSVTLHLGDRDVTLTVVDSATLKGNAADFDIADFETINFDFYG